eukprot:scaffold2.g7046.t1
MKSRLVCAFALLALSGAASAAVLSPEEGLAAFNADLAEALSRRTLQQTNDMQRTFPQIQQFFADMLGGNWTSFLPQSWSLPSFNWDSLGSFEYQSNMQARGGEGRGTASGTPPPQRPPRTLGQAMRDFLDTADLSRPSSLLDLQSRLEHVESHFCTHEIFNASILMPASCTGPTVTLAFLPKVCTLDSANKAVICDPAKLVLQKTPGSCVHAYHSAAIWKGKECAIKGVCGFAKANVHGGSEYHIPLQDLHLGDLTL